jgi:alpha-beta hydrolase superfamily lysophospholipase
MFLDLLSTELGDIQHKITRLLWSGANSIFVRDNTAHILAEHLSAEHTAHPEATQLIIAHSHGGNIALRALHHLQKREVSSHSADTANPLVVTLATPFIEIHQTDFGLRPSYIRGAVLYVCPVKIVGNVAFSVRTF